MKEFTQSINLLKLTALTLLASVLVTPLVGCGGSNVDDEYLAEQYEDNLRLKTTYDSIKGTYSGIATSTSDKSRTYRSELVLYTSEVDNGTDAYGNKRTRPVLKGRFRLLDLFGEFDNQILDASYDKLSGALVLVQIAKGGSGAASGAAAGMASLGNGAGLTAGSTSEITIRGTVMNNAVRATITLEGGDWATFNADLISRETPAAADTPSEDQRIRMEAILRPYVGVYEGMVKGGVGSSAFPARFSIFLSQDGETPVLRAIYSRPDMPSDPYTFSLNISFSPLTRRIYMTTLGSGLPSKGSGSGNGQAANYILANGTLDPGLLIVDIEHARLGYQGRVEAKKVQ